VGYLKKKHNLIVGDQLLRVKIKLRITTDLPKVEKMHISGGIWFWFAEKY
jgi:hypothetical protein